MEKKLVNGIEIPRSHYDDLMDREEGLSEFLAQDIQHIKATNLKGPFGSTDDFSSLHDSYFDQKLDRMKTELRQKVDAVSGGMDDIEFNRLFNESPYIRDAMVSLTSDYLSALNFELFNKKVFYLTEGLIGQLAHTEMDAPSEYVRLPFSSCIFILDNKDAIQEMYRLQGIEPVTTNAPITVYLSELPFKGFRKLLIVAYHSKGNDVHFLVKRELLIRPDWTIERSLHTDWNELYKDNEKWLDEDQDKPSLAEVLGIDGDEQHFYNEGLTFFRIIINAILYLASSDPEITETLSKAGPLKKSIGLTMSRPKRNKLKKNLKKLSPLDGNVVGSSIGHIVVDRHKQAKNGKGTGSGMHLKRILVRGHWRNQPHGQERKLRKLIFIAPHYKGPDMGDILNKPYVVK
jgi:hypothetical protein